MRWDAFASGSLRIFLCCDSKSVTGRPSILRKERCRHTRRWFLCTQFEEKRSTSLCPANGLNGCHKALRLFFDLGINASNVLSAFQRETRGHRGQSPALPGCRSREQRFCRALQADRRLRSATKMSKNGLFV